MLRSEAKESIIREPQRYLSLDNQSKNSHSRTPSYICPICGSGTGAKGTGITSKDGIHFTCWAGCFTNSDIIDIIGLEYGLTDYNAKLERACIEYGIDYSKLESDYNIGLTSAKAVFKDDHKSVQNQSKNGQNTGNTANTEQTDYTEFFKECAQHRIECDYLTKRGISQTVQASFLIGYCQSWRSPKALKRGSNPPATPRIIIPTSRYSYIARDTRPADSLTDKEKEYVKMKEGSLALFNLNALEDMKEPVFVVEGEIDALSIIEIGYKALALGSTTNYKRLLDHLKENRPAQSLLIALDNDESGNKITEKLVNGLRELNIESYKVNINGSYKDPNEYLMGNREAFKNTVADAVEISKAAKETQKQEYLKTSTAYHLQGFIDGIAESVNTPYIPTGFNILDNLFDGGLYEGLYIVGAISSLGKTTLITQIADQVAQAGNDVLIFSLEMARTEIMSKSISRLTLLDVQRTKGDMRNAKTARGITSGIRYSRYSQAEKELIQRSITAYGEYANNIYIYEGIGDIGANEVREKVKDHITFTGNKPVVVIDYLQILAPADVRATDKQNTDKAVMELKRISRDYKIPVIGISSFNRANYTVSVTMEAFKESGAIEYSSDVLIGLQLKGAGTKNFDVDEAKAKSPREVELKILKNRNGITGRSILYNYYPMFNYFEELELMTAEKKV